VDRKISEREAIQKMVMEKIGFFSEVKDESHTEEYESGIKKLKIFLQKRMNG
jgi:hypothetical protein